MKLLLENWRRYLKENVDTSQLTPELIGTVIKKYGKWFKGKEEIDTSGIKDPNERAVIDSIMLFTSRNVGSVRDPEKFDLEKAGKLRGQQITKDMYLIANHVIRILATMENPFGPADIWRGMGLPQALVNNMMLGKIKDFDLGSISSWTTNKHMGVAFALLGGGDGLKPGEVPVLFYIKKSPYGIPISALSGYKSEEEYLLGGKIIVDNIQQAEYDSTSNPEMEKHFGGERFPIYEVSAQYK